MSSIPLQLITGFLGSGKTTFLKNYLQHCSGDKRIAIIQNEFGPANMDGQELQLSAKNYHILEINNGSVFCVCLLGSFIDSLAQFIDEVQPDELLLEASGMSDPTSIGQIMQAEKLKSKVFIDHIWCLTDALHFERISKLQTRINHQVSMADTIILNKCDLAPDSIDSVQKELIKLNPFAPIEAVSYGQVSFQRKKFPFKTLPGTQHQISRPDLQSLVIKTNKSISEKNLEQFLDEHQNTFVRCKGYVALHDGRTVAVQGVYEHYEIKPSERTGKLTELVAIGTFSDASPFIRQFENYCTHDA